MARAGESGAAEDDGCGCFISTGYEYRRAVDDSGGAVGGRKAEEDQKGKWGEAIVSRNRSGPCFEECWCACALRTPTWRVCVCMCVWVGGSSVCHCCARVRSLSLAQSVSSFLLCLVPLSLTALPSQHSRMAHLTAALLLACAALAVRHTLQRESARVSVCVAFSLFPRTGEWMWKTAADERVRISLKWIGSGEGERERERERERTAVIEREQQREKERSRSFHSLSSSSSVFSSSSLFLFAATVFPTVRLCLIRHFYCACCCCCE